MLHGKQKHVSETYAQMECVALNTASEPMHLQFLASEKSIAFRYFFPHSQNVSTKYIVEEKTSFRIATAPNDYQLLQPYDGPTPKSQTFYQPRDDRSRSHIGEAVSETGFGLPALFYTEVDSTGFFIYLKETGFDGRYPMSHISNQTDGANFRLAFPDPADGNGNMNTPWAHSPLPWSTPWRVLTIGTSPQSIIEDTSTTDLAEPAKVADAEFVKPGISSWSWWSDKTNARNYTATEEFIQLASEESWQYTLLDAQWDQQVDASDAPVPLETIGEFATDRNVKLWVWMNSAGVNNDASYIANSPKDLLWQPSIRRQTMSRFAKMGVAGIKVDGIQSDKQEMVQYLIDVLEDAAAAGLMVVLHNCAPPRGLERTWPNLLGHEGLIASEYYANAKVDYGSQMPENNVNQAFVTYPNGPIDYAPGTFSRDLYINDSMLTTDAHETALNIIIDTGFRCLPDTPVAYQEHVSSSIMDLIRDIPFGWDNVYYLAGEPGKFIVIAKRSGKDLYIGAINGETSFVSPTKYKFDPTWKPAKGVARDITIDLSQLNLRVCGAGTIITDQKGSQTARVDTDFHGTQNGASLKVHMEPFGGFAARLSICS